ncbi:MAG: glycosyl transferase family 1 [Acidimicrobiaceae bacterium]|nr:glycosyl transferase family 1 [Acidimicrobiaceae bacterium]MEC7427987.1 glycosyltransferase family 4 protein [Actinomycetota bacterium]HAQ43051.1 glycosyl transferase family 1 [Acidimicrobiaceae bacterium]|tara:strand:+ start:417 stop:1688 length:1272 start_codon:yes stop_codon:yes gene_type:complete
MSHDGPLRIAFLTYRGHPYTGGQGVYTRHMARELVELGHHVEVISGPPYPHLDDGVALTELPSLDLYRMPDPFRIPRLSEFKDRFDVLEYAVTAAATFAEPLTFSLRAHRNLMGRLNQFDLVHDNQCLGTGIWKIHDAGLPVLETIHHPITVDRRLETKHAPTPWKRFTKNRFYAFTGMQTKVARKLPRILTVSSNSYDDIIADYGVDPERLHIVHVGVDPQQFRPIDNVNVVPGRLMTTASADVAMKGLAFLLEALAKLRAKDDSIHLVVIGKPKYDSKATQLIKELNLAESIEFVSGVTDQRIVELYNEAEVAIVPSLYEGFSLPAIEAMSCGVPLVATTGGALPEVVGADGVTALQVPPGDSDALAQKIGWALEQTNLRSVVGAAGRERVIQNFSWKITAERTVEHYRALLAEVSANAHS